MTNTELELPQGWITALLPDVVKNEKSAIKRGPFGSHLKKEFFVKSGYKVYEQQHAINNDFTLGRYYINEEKFQELKNFQVKEDDIIISCSGTIGKIAVAPKNIEKGIINQALLKISLNEDIMPREFFKYLFKFWMNKSEIDSHGSGMGNLSSVKSLKKTPILLPPLNEQKRIISKIEELFSKVDSTKQSLDKIKLQLEQYRYSYHNWIFHGNFKEKFNFSSNWEEKPLGKIFKIIGGGTPDTKKSQYWDGNIPWITSADIHGIKNIIPRRRVSQLGIDNSATHKIPPNSILVVTRVGLGKLAITSEPICINQDIQAVIIDSNIVLPLFVLNYLSQTIQIFRFRNQGTTISGVTKKQLADIPFFLPSLDEQEKIIGHMEMAEARIQNSKSIVNSTLQNLQTMKMSVLKQAFEGKLVPQDPNDEPASVLLERIKLKN